MDWSLLVTIGHLMTIGGSVVILIFAPLAMLEMWRRRRKEEGR